MLLLRESKRQLKHALLLPRLESVRLTLNSPRTTDTLWQLTRDPNLWDSPLVEMTTTISRLPEVPAVEVVEEEAAVVVVPMPPELTPRREPEVPRAVNLSFLKRPSPLCDEHFRLISA